MFPMESVGTPASPGPFQVASKPDPFHAPANSGSFLAPPRRLVSLDVLRGITIAFMIMVNNTGGEGAWTQMRHAAWNGLTATDLVFPTFLFVVGASIVFSTQARLLRGASRARLAWHTLRRAVILFLLGIVVNGFPVFPLHHLRIYGVLQRIAICYLIVSLLYLWDRRVWTKIVLLAVLLSGYWVLVRYVPVPGAGLPVRDIPLLDKDQNIVAWLDRQLMPGHLYEEFTTHNARDPEGLLSDIPAVATTLMGLFTGLWLCNWLPSRIKAAGIAAAAAACLASGYLWAHWFPLNKKMWTSSYVLVAAGWSLLLFAVLYWALEKHRSSVKAQNKGIIWPFLVFGSNAILAYMISELLERILGFVQFTAGGRRTSLIPFLYQHVFMHIADSGWRALAYSVSYTFVCFIPVWILYNRKIFIKV
jgi:predicted acyltransferase